MKEEDESSEQEEVDLDNIYSIGDMWRFRNRITVEHLMQELEENMSGTKQKQIRSQYKVLHKFLQMVSVFLDCVFYPTML